MKTKNFYFESYRNIDKGTYFFNITATEEFIKTGYIQMPQLCYIIHVHMYKEKHNTPFKFFIHRLICISSKISSKY